MTLTEFLLARIAEDEELAQSCVDDEPYWFADRNGISQGDSGGRVVSGYFNQDRRPAANWHIARWDPARVLAECKAKRQIVERHNPCDDWSYGDPRTCPELAALVLPSVDHPDFDPAWRV